MKKPTIVILIILVIAILAATLIYVLNPSEIMYVGDYRTVTDTGNYFLVKRLYSSNVDEEKMAELANSGLTTSFTEDEVLAAALKAGRPEFYPWFYFEVMRGEDGEIRITGQLSQTLADEQTTVNYRSTGIRLEAVATGLTIDESKSVLYGSNERTNAAERVVPVIAEDGSSLAAQLDTAGAFDLALNGSSGTLMLQYRYNISTTNILFTSDALTDQLLVVYVTINDNGTDLTATYELADAYLVSDMY